MRRPVATILCIIGCHAAMAAADIQWNFDQNGSQNLTHRRERENRIPSVYGDIRLPIAGVRPAVPLGSNKMTTTVSFESAPWIVTNDSPFARRIEDPKAEQSAGFAVGRFDSEIRWTWQTGWDWLGTEVILPFSQAPDAYSTDIPQRATSVAASDGDGDFRIGDIGIRCVTPLTSSRYGALSLVYGADIGIPDFDGQFDTTLFQGDLMTQHGAITPRLGLRGTIPVPALDMVVATIDAEGGWNHWARWTPAGTDDQHDDSDDNVSTIEHDYASVKIGMSLSWRVTRWFRVAAVQRFDWQRWWNDPDDAMDFTAARSPTMLALGFTPITGCHLDIHGGVDWISNRELRNDAGLGISDTFTCGGSATFVF